MKIVTNYAEKKAKQFHNLLQGYTKGIRITAILILLLMGVNNAWAYTAHFSLMGDPVGNWNNDRDFMINTGTGTTDEWYIYAYVATNQYFALNNGSSQYGPSSNGKEIKQNTGGGQGSYNTNSWKFTGTSGIIKICCAESQNREWYPWVWVEESAPIIKFKHPWNGGSWSEQTATKQNDGTYTYDGKYGNNEGFNAGPSGKYKYNASQTTVEGSPATGDMCRFIWNPVGYVQGGAETKASGTFKIVKLCSLTYDGNGKTGGTVPSATNNQLYNTSITLSSNTLTKAGYTHTGWNTKADGTGAHYDKGASYTLTAVSTTLYAEWTPAKYTITYKDQGGSNFSGTHESGYPTTHTYGTATTLKTASKTGYTFEGWYKEPACTNKVTSLGATAYTANITLYAKWTLNATYSLNVVAGDGISQVAGSTDPVTLGSTYDIKATPKTGYTFSIWTANPAANATFGNATTANTTVTVKNGSVTVTASATENTHNVIVSYKCGDITIQDNTTSNVGEVNAQSITAPNIDGYTFREWTLGDGITNKSANTTTNPISITTKASGAYTLTATYEELPHVYFVNTARWTTINIHAWKDGGNGTTWPGTQLTTPVETINGFDVYKYILPEGTDYNKVIFNNISNSNGVQTADLNWENGKYYVYSANKWVDKNEVENILPKPVIYFKNNLGWKEVYVYFHQGEYWGDADNQGSGSSGLTEANGRVCKMEKVGETDIYKFDYSEKDFVPGNVISFTKDKQADYGNFHKTEATYRSDYNPNMELFVPQATPNETKNETKYYNKGIWMKYNSIESGYSIAGKFNDWKADPNPLLADGIGGYSFYTDVQLEAQTEYQFKILNINNDWFGKKSTNITSTTTSDIMLEVGSGDEYNVTITPQTSGTHTFTIDLIEGKLLLHVEYPVTSGDYRIVYAEKENGSTYSKFHVAQTVQKGDNTTKFVSAFVDTEKKPFVLLQKWNDGWITTEEKEINLKNFPNLKGNGVYNFWVSQTNGEATIHSQIDKYTGSYYIRTNCANGGWRKYLSTQDNAMTYSQKALNHGGYDYYYCKWIQHAGSNISYTIANDYSFSISDTLTTDDIVDLGILPASAYVRFTWNSQTNKLERAYIGESVAIEGKNLKDTIGTDKNVLIPSKLNDWQYQVEAQANANTNIQVVADYNSHEQYLKGTLGQPEKIISGTTTRDYLVRLTYDFRTNQLLSTLIDNNKISDSISINSIIISREHHNAAQSINITATGSINNIENATAVMTFEKGTLNNKSITETERALYWVSFPFPVKLSEVTGNGIYGEHWILEEYDGKARAENGCWAEDTYWKYIEDSTDKILYPHMGYVLALDLTKLGEESNVYDENGTFAIHFPSYSGALSQLTTAPLEGFSTIKFPEHKCTINRPTDDGDRTIKDSNWNIIGVPSFADVHDFTTQVGEDVNFYYQWNPADDTYSPQPAATFQTMHAYMVQFAGTIDWGAKTAVSPAAIAARKNAASKDQYTLRLVLQQEGKDQDQTFIRLLADGATNEFDMNVDLSKIINRGTNIYSLIGKEEAAANVLPIEESIIPIGVDIAETGTYTFAMPDGTDGITAILIDYETQTEHNLLTTEYTVDLNKGISNKRFALRVLPHHVATNIESLLDGNSNQNVQKFIINGQLFIKNNGHIYDIQGREVK